jgi:hypothetical protein
MTYGPSECQADMTASQVGGPPVRSSTCLNAAGAVAVTTGEPVTTIPAMDRTATRAVLDAAGAAVAPTGEPATTIPAMDRTATWAVLDVFGAVVMPTGEPAMTIPTMDRTNTNPGEGELDT